MKEDFLHNIWKFKRFDHHRLQTACGLDLNIINYGVHNHGAGPDFTNAFITLAGTSWAGHIEIHINSSDWKKHRHQKDPAYNNVILHVVYNHDYDATSFSGHRIPVLVLDGKIDINLIKKHDHSFQKNQFIPCEKSLINAPWAIPTTFLERLLVERIEIKSKQYRKLLKSLNNDWETLCFRLTCIYFGFNGNKQAFEMLAERLELNVLRRYQSNVFQLEALFFGQAGLLSAGIDNYWDRLFEEYTFLKRKHKLIPMTGTEWRFSRMRPVGFPTIRIAQLAKLIHRHIRLFNSIKENVNIKHWYGVLSILPSSYWKNHFMPGRPSKASHKQLGRQSCEIIITNVFIPLIFTYAYETDNIALIEKLIDLYHAMPSEKNKIVRQWKSLKVKSRTAGESQALFHLKSQYCDRFRCMECQIGTKLLFE